MGERLSGTDTGRDREIGDRKYVGSTEEGGSVRQERGVNGKTKGREGKTRQENRNLARKGTQSDDRTERRANGMRRKGKGG